MPDWKEWQSTVDAEDKVKVESQVYRRITQGSEKGNSSFYAMVPKIT
jgi:hypothetical protein